MAITRTYTAPIREDRLTWRERIAELKRIYGGSRPEVRMTAIGWQPDPSYKEVSGTKPREYSKVVRKAKP